jgi:glycosyltransferase involved in cell wall biosynthesis
VAYAGALHPSKGVQVLVQAAGLLPPGTAAVTVAGDLDAYPAFARALRAAAGPAVAFCGRLDRAGVGALLARSDVLAVPSLWFENAPLVVSEAFGAGIPVVASDIGALAEKVRDGIDGLLHPQGDSAALAATLRRLAEEPGLLERLRSGVRPGATRAEHHTAMLSLYAELAQGRAPAGVAS